MPRPSIVAGLALASIGVVDAASARDCGRAVSAQDLAICGSPALLAKDDALSRTYFDTLRLLKGERHDLLLASQREWLKQRDASSCAEPLETCIAQRIDARRRFVAACFQGEDIPLAQSRADITCPYYHHAGCPTLDMTGSAGLAHHPFLIKSAVDALKKSLNAFDCTPDTGSGGSRESNMESIDEALILERPGFVSVESLEAFCARGAIHCYSTEGLDTYDLASSRVITIEQLLPGYTQDGPLDAKIRDVLDGHLEKPCCEQDDPKKDTSFSDLNGVAPVPSGWTVTDRGDLKLGYTYIALGRTYLATGVVPRSAVIDAVDPRFRSLLAPPPPQPRKSGPPRAAAP